MRLYLSLSRKKDIILSFLLGFFVIDCMIMVVTFIPIFYDMQIESSGILNLVTLDKQTIAKNFHSIVHYLSFFYRGEMIVPDFVLSQNALRHFQDVKNIFDILEIYLIISPFIIVPFIISCIKEHHFHFLRLTGTFILSMMIIIGIACLIDFNQVFTLMHQILFRNSYWIMDPSIDPVINIFPESFFALLGGLLVSGIALISVFMIGLYYYLRNHYLKKEGNI